MIMIVWGGVAVSLGAAGLVVVAAVLAGRLRLGERRERWHDQTTGPAGAMFNALFLAALALSVVIAWQHDDHAHADTAQEAAAVSALADASLALPDAATPRQYLTEYTQDVITTEWGSSTATSTTTRVVRRMHEMILRLPASQAAQEAVRDVDQLIAAHQARLSDAGSRLPTGLLACLVTTAFLVLTHGLLVGSPHSVASLTPLLAEAAVLAAAIWIVFAIRQPFHGALAMEPDGLRTALAQLTATGAP